MDTETRNIATIIVVVLVLYLLSYIQTHPAALKTAYPIFNP